ncbi:TetR family transcriptional regulator C-terminal domain-containing protein [Vibrio salinus]|uniref:TetR family transcriptional regulator C-terminal domain-containing protein n=1 Tax=Vibrio salinus TaxID=2899784 RepID=UPI001E2B5EEC|nr:TetR family transcriptional regulator C-terminal domain-containing protein [Vibrio salinus]MCE0493697.1 TetR/AcrR family transcriptional regulator [Vibrio salinus]
MSQIPSKKNHSPSANRIAMEQRILRGAEQIFAEYGYRGASMDTIARHIGISKQNVIYYFSSKEELYRGVLKHIVDLWLEHMFFSEHDGKTPESIITSYIRGKLELSRDYPYASKVFAQEIISGAPMLKNYLQEKLRPLFEKDIQIVKSWIDQGYLIEFEPEHLFFTIWSTTQTYADFSTQIQLLLNKPALEEQDFEHATQFLTQLVLRGIVAPK